MALLTREQIQAAAKLKVEEVAVPEWGGSVRIRELTLEEWFAVIRFEAGLDEKMPVPEKQSRASARAVSIALIDEEGRPIFTEAELFEMGRAAGSAVTSLLGHVLRLCGSTPAAQEETLKNSEPAPSVNS